MCLPDHSLPNHGSILIRWALVKPCVFGHLPQTAKKNLSHKRGESLSSQRPLCSKSQSVVEAISGWQVEHSSHSFHKQQKLYRNDDQYSFFCFVIHHKWKRTIEVLIFFIALVG
ncbi:MAG: hypothetical protein IJS54_07965 [Desulfovibrio sp.]|nr:hypothetical protein [Desulfovibrio sp.]